MQTLTKQIDEAQHPNMKTNTVVPQTYINNRYIYIHMHVYMYACIYQHRGCVESSVHTQMCIRLYAATEGWTNGSEGNQTKRQLVLRWECLGETLLTLQGVSGPKRIIHLHAALQWRAERDINEEEKKEKIERPERRERRRRKEESFPITLLTRKKHGPNAPLNNNLCTHAFESPWRM